VFCNFVLDPGPTLACTTPASRWRLIVDLVLTDQRDVCFRQKAGSLTGGLIVDLILMGQRDVCSRQQAGSLTGGAIVDQVVMDQRFVISALIVDLVVTGQRDVLYQLVKSCSKYSFSPMTPWPTPIWVYLAFMMLARWPGDASQALTICSGVKALAEAMQ
jgi:hypothetical protein